MRRHVLFAFHFTQIDISLTESPQFQNPSDWKDSKNLLSHEFGHTLGAELHDDKLGYNEEMAPDLIMWSKVIFFHKSKYSCWKFPLFLVSACFRQIVATLQHFFPSKNSTFRTALPFKVCSLHNSTCQKSFTYIPTSDKPSWSNVLTSQVDSDASVWSEKARKAIIAHDKEHMRSCLGKGGSAEKTKARKGKEDRVDIWHDSSSISDFWTLLASSNSWN